MNKINLLSIIEDAGLWPDFLVSVFNSKNSEAGLPFSSDTSGVLLAAKKRVFPSLRRQLLTDILQKQNRDALETFPKIKEHLDLLSKEGTFTITTGHQLSLSGGPLFLWYKLCTVVAHARYLSRVSGSVVLPVFWMASEDHDLQELNDFSLFGKKIHFEPSYQGAAGRLPMETLEQWAKEFTALSGAHDAGFLWKAFLQGRNLAEATRHWVNAAFGDDGLLVLDADDALLKQEFLPLAIRELESGFSGDAVSSRTKELIESGVASEKEWPVHPRNLNLFWLNETGRHRLIRNEDGSVTAGLSGEVHSIKQWKELFAQSPQSVSPNVVLRPIYQELILPNLAYVGGPGECAYWLQLSGVFREANLPYPVLLPRRNFLLLTQKQIEQWTSAGFTLSDILLDAEQIRKRVGESGLPAFIHDASEAALLKVYERVLQEVNAIDSSLSATVLAEQQKALNGMDVVRNKLMKSIRNKDEQRLNRLMKISGAVRPDGKPQERAVHLFQFPYLCFKDNREQMIKLCEEPGIRGLYVICADELKQV